MHWSDFHSSARQREFVKSRQFASAGWCDREAVPIFSQLGVPAIVPRLPERGAGTCGGRTAPRPCQGALRAQLGRRDTCPCSCTPQWPWCPHLQLPTPRRRPCAGAGGGSPQMRGLGRSPSWWHLGSSGAVPGLAGDGEAPAPPAGGGHPSAGGTLGVPLSPPATGGAKTSSYAGMCILSTEEGGKSSGWGRAPTGTRWRAWGQLGQSCRSHRVCLGWRWKCSVPVPWGTAPARQSSPCCWNSSPSQVLTSRAHLSPPRPAVRTSPPQRDGPIPDPAAWGIQDWWCHRGSQCHPWGGQGK